MSISHPNVRDLAGLANLHSKRWAAEQVVQGLVPEGSHFLIARMELADGLFSTYRKVRGMAAV